MKVSKKLNISAVVKIIKIIPLNAKDNTAIVILLKKSVSSKNAVKIVFS